MISGVALLGYAYSVEDLYAVPIFNGIAVHTAVTLFVLALASILVRPQGGWAAVVGSRSGGGAATRRQLAFMAVPLVAGLVLLQAMRSNNLSAAAAMAILVVLTVTPLALLILRDGRVLDALDAERQAKSDMHATTAETLKARLAEQAAQEPTRQATLRYLLSGALVFGPTMLQAIDSTATHRLQSCTVLIPRRRSRASCANGS